MKEADIGEGKENEERKGRAEKNVGESRNEKRREWIEDGK